MSRFGRTYPIRPLVAGQVTASAPTVVWPEWMRAALLRRQGERRKDEEAALLMILALAVE